jgi:hypothetical protein
MGCQYRAGLTGDYTQAPPSSSTGGSSSSSSVSSSSVSSSSSNSSSSSSSSTGSSGCERATYPDPPGGIDDGTTVGTLVFAVQSVDLGDMGTTPGYDLDYTCTCFDDAGPSCVGASPQASTYCDALGGIDSQWVKVLQLLELAVGSATFGSTEFSSQAYSGRWNLLIQVSGYNGKMNDPSVEVAIFPSNGTSAPPQWMGADAWGIPASAVGDGGVATPLFRSNGAYVTNGVLVATMPTVEVTFHGGELDTFGVRVLSGVLTGSLGEGIGGYDLQGGVLAGRWALPDIFQSLSRYRDDDGNPVCTTSPGYSIVKSSVCNDADILVDSTQPKSAPCDALSLAFGFNAQQAVLGAINDGGKTTPGCPAATDPANDMCP